MYDDSTMGSFAPLADTAGYSQDKFYTRSRDTHGHDKLLRHGNGPKEVIHTPPELYAIFYEMKGHFPEYRTNADIMRDALVHLSHMRSEQLKNPTAAILTEMQRYKAIAEVERLRARIASEKAFLVEVDSLYKDARTPQDRADLEGAIREYLVTCDNDEVRSDLERLLQRL